MRILYKGYVPEDRNNAPELFKEFFTKIRDGLRAGVASNSMDVRVSDIGRWDGRTSGSEGYAFVIKINNHEWLFLSGYHPTTFNSRRLRDFLGTATGSIDQIVQNEGGGTIGTSRDVMFIHYNYEKFSYTMSFDDEEQLTYSGGDYSTVPSPPTGATFSPFFGDHLNTMRGVSFSSIPRNTGVLSSRKFTVMLDDQNPFVSCWGASLDPKPHSIAYLGNIFVNEDVADTHKNGVLSFRLNTSGAFTGSETGDPSSANNRVEGLDINGDPMNFNLSFVNTYNVYNARDGAGDYRWRTVEAINVAYEKGIIDTNILRVQGPQAVGIDMGMFYAGPEGPFQKVSHSFAAAYIENEPPFPFFNVDFIG